MNEMIPEQAFKFIIAAQVRFARFARVFKKSNKATVLFPLVILVFVTLGCRMLQPSPHKKDAQLTAQFRQNKEKFNRLVAMVKEDKKQVSVYEIEKGWLKNISGSRVDEYKKLLGDLNLLGVYPHKPDKNSGFVTQIEFRSSYYEKEGEFDCKYTEYKGFMWYESGRQPANREVRDLDWEYTKGSDITAESRIDDNWSIHYSHEPCFHD